jgi:hypothetical protein
LFRDEPVVLASPLAEHRLHVSSECANLLALGVPKPARRPTIATTTKTPQDLNSAAEQIIQLNERLVEAGKRTGNLYLDSYDKLVEGVISFQQKLAEQSQNDAVKSVVGTQVDVTRQIASAYTSAARELIS